MLSDGLGSVRQALDESGVVVAYNEFDPYGNPVQHDSLPYSYTGEWWQEEVELLHLRARWYMPETGTFLSRDPWRGDIRRGQSQNGWSYVEGNPINLTDPSGNDPWWCEGRPDEEECYQSYNRNFGWVHPTSGQQSAIDLETIWLVTTEKPACAGPRIGAQIRPDRLNFETPDELMRYWLAWEEENPCYYRDGANCQAVALEISELYVQSQDTSGYIREEDGFSDPQDWPNLVDKDYFKQDTWPHRNEAGDIITYKTEQTFDIVFGDVMGYSLEPSDFPTHIVVVTDHYTDGQQLCYEKISPYDYYQLKPCNDRGSFVSPFFDKDQYSPVPNP